MKPEFRLPLMRLVLAWMALVPVVVLAPLGVALGLVFLPAGEGLYRYTYGAYFLPFELMAWLATGVGVACCAWVWRRAAAEGTAPIRDPAFQLALGAVIVFLAHLPGYSEYGMISAFDYECYDRAAQAILAGTNPYEGTDYLYPPLTAQVMAAGLWLAENQPVPLVHEQYHTGLLVFYVYQSLQYLSLPLLAVLLAGLVRQLSGWGWGSVVVLVVGVLLLCHPLTRTLRHLQVNLWCLVGMVAAVLAAERRPILAGLALALAAHIKIYPLVLLLPWVLSGRWAASASAVGGVVAFAAAGAFLPGGLGVYTDWWGFLPRLAGGGGWGVEFLRSNTVVSFLENARRLLLGADAPFSFASLWFVWPLRVLIIGGFLVRHWQRSGWPLGARAIASTMDAFALLLLLSPLAWPHAFLFSVPFFLWCVVVLGRNGAGTLAGAGVLMLVLPTIDLFPLSYTRLAGLLWLVVATWPRVPAQS